MASTFTTIQTTVANYVQDTTSEMKTLIGGYINGRYRDVLRRINWEAPIFSYSFDTVAGQALYTLPSDFKKEIYVYDSTSNSEMGRVTLQQYANTLRSSNTSNGSPSYYTIINALTSTPSRYSLMKIINTPDSAYTIEMPYSVEPADLAGSAYPIIACEQALEYGATADAQRFKRQFAKAADYENLYEKAINTLIWDSTNQTNQVVQFMPQVQSRETV